MLKIKDNVNFLKIEKLEYDDFNEQYDYEYSREIEISIDKYSRTLTTYFYDIGEIVELNNELDTTIKDLKKFAPFLIDLVEEVEIDD